MSKFAAVLALAFATLTVASVAPPTASAQAAYTATGPGKYIAVGATGSVFNADYGQTRLAGGTVFVDANLYWKWGAEVEARQLRFHEDPDGAHQSTYLIGPRISFHPKNFRPYVKFLVGRGEFTFPFNYGQGSYFVMAPGAGVDWRIAHTRVFWRVVDVQYQYWPNFNFGAPGPYPTIHPYGISTGVDVRVWGQK